jgi:hypothetical protein
MPEDLSTGNQAEQLLVPRKRAAGLVGMSPRSFDRYRKAGLIGPREIKVGSRLLYCVAELRQWASSAVNGKLPDREAWLRMKQRDNGQCCATA